MAELAESSWSFAEDAEILEALVREEMHVVSRMPNRGWEHARARKPYIDRIDGLLAQWLIVAELGGFKDERLAVREVAS